MSDLLNENTDDLIVALRDGKDLARDLLLKLASDQMLRLTRKMLRKFPVVHRWEDTDDIYQEALIRLYNALGNVTPSDSRHFYALAAKQIRWQLLDMARKYSGPLGLAWNHDSRHLKDESHDPINDNCDSTSGPSELAEWTEFHEQVARLTSRHREVFDLLFYQQLTKSQAAEILKVGLRTVTRRWIAARLELSERLDGRIPEF